MAYEIPLCFGTEQHSDMNTNATWLGTKRKMKTRKQLMQELNKLLKTDFNWSRLSKLDLERLVNAIEEVK